MNKPTFSEGYCFRREDIMRLVLYYNATYSIGRHNYLRFDFDGLDCRLYVTGKYDFHNSYGIGMLDYNIFCYHRYNSFGERYIVYWTSLQNAGEWLVSNEDGIKSVFEQCELCGQTFSCGGYDFISPHKSLNHDDWRNVWHYLEYKPKAKKYKPKNEPNGSK